MSVERDGQTISGRWFSRRLRREGTRRHPDPPRERAARPRADPARAADGHHDRGAHPRGEPAGARAPRSTLARACASRNVAARRRGSRARRSRSRPTRPSESVTSSWGRACRPAGRGRVQDGRRPQGHAHARASPGSEASASRSVPSSSRRGPGATARTASPTRRTTSTSGSVDAAWSLEEFTATFGDDDKLWAGTIDAKGLFTPAEDGPNPKRRGNRNNVGDLWVVATLDAASSLEAGGAPARPRPPHRDRAPLRPLGPARGDAMSAVAAREMHRFRAGGREFAYLVPSAAIFALDETAARDPRPPGRQERRR